MMMFVYQPLILVVYFSDGESVSSAEDEDGMSSTFTDHRSEARDSILGEDHKDYQNESHA